MNTWDRESRPETHRSHHTTQSGGTTNRSHGSHLHDEDRMGNAGEEDAAASLPGAVGGGTLALTQAPSFMESKVRE